MYAINVSTRSWNVHGTCLGELLDEFLGVVELDVGLEFEGRHDDCLEKMTGEVKERSSGVYEFLGFSG